MKLVMAAEGIRKTYHKNMILSGFNMRVFQGDVYGLIGKNGAGKTTFFKILLGLVYADAGTIELFGSTNEKERAEARKKLNGIVETPAFYPHMSAYENLTAYCLLRDIKKSKISDSLESVGLGGVGKKKVGRFSLGMKQRLGIARAIISDSKLVILDEPTNGLDPEGIAEFRKLVADLSQNYDMTFIVSSHHITELQNISNRLGLLVNGRIVEELSAAEILDKTKPSVILTVSSVAECSRVLKRDDLAVPHRIEDAHIVINEADIDIARICATLSENNILVSDVQKTTGLLEDYIIKVITPQNGKGVVG